MCGLYHENLIGRFGRVCVAKGTPFHGRYQYGWQARKIDTGKGWGREAAVYPLGTRVIPDGFVAICTVLAAVLLAGATLTARAGDIDVTDQAFPPPVGHQLAQAPSLDKPADAAPGEATVEDSAAAHADLFAESRYPSAGTCGTCHPKQYKEWSVSQHAYSQLSPV